MKKYFILILLITSLFLAKGVLAEDPVTVTPETQSSSKNTYRLLAPIGNLTEVQTSGGTCPGNPTMPNGIGCYLNIIFKIAIGLCGVLAVVMLVINFIGYMSSESFTEKAKFKEKFWGPIGGLLLALGAYAILVTINPSLTGKDGLTVEQVGEEVESEDYGPTPQEAATIVQSYRSGTGAYKDIDLGPTSLPDTTEGIINLPGIIKNEVAPVIEPNRVNNVKGILIHGTAGGGTPNAVIANWIDNNIRYKRGERKRTVTYKGKSVTVDVVPSSAHFVVGKDGSISQAVRVTRATNHCGKCTKPGTTSNTSISIEVVMSCVKDCGTPRSEKKAVWEEPTRAQVASMTLLVNLLLARYPTLDKDRDLYTHGEQASNRTYNEGRNTLDAIKPYLKNGR